MPRIAQMITTTALLTIAVAIKANACDATLCVTLPDGSTQGFSNEEIREMPTTEFETSTIWTEGVTHFTGVELHTLLEDLGVESGMLKAVAANDYAVQIPVDDAMVGGPIIAYDLNGAPMSLRDKGPLWIVYPYDSDHHYQSEVIYSRSIWQLTRIEVQP
ncbi:MAG: molybdopterin-dependent oxidoreductase [Pseudomonadota bacterium]